MATTRNITKSPFGVPSLETASRIDNVDKTTAFTAAHYRMTARLRQLECEFEAKASEICTAFLAEVAEIGDTREAE